MPIRLNSSDEAPRIEIDVIGLAEAHERGEVQIVHGQPEERIKELEAQLAEAQKYNTFNGQYEEYITGEAFNAMEGYIQEKAHREKLEARLEAIDAALDDADAPDATEAHALDNDPIIERIKLWKHAQSGVAEMLEARAEAAEKKEHEMYLLATDFQQEASRLMSDNQQLRADAGRLRAAVEAYPEWTDDDPQAVGTMQRFVTCIVCGGGGAFNGDGKPSKRMPPTHKPDCARQAALSAGQEGAAKEGEGE